MVRKPSAQADDNEPVPAAPLMQCVTLCQYFNSFLFVVGGAGNTINDDDDQDVSASAELGRAIGSDRDRYRSPS